MLVEQKGVSKGKFTFTTSESGDHNICLTALGAGGWFTSTKTKVTFDLLFGDISHDVTSGSKVAADGKKNHYLSIYFAYLIMLHI